MYKYLLPVVALLASAPLSAAQATFQSSDRSWLLQSDRIAVTLQMTPEGYFQLRSIYDARTHDQWSPPAYQPVSPILFTAGGTTFDVSRPYLLIDQYSQPVEPSGIRQYIVLQDLAGAGQVTAILEVYDGQPVLHYSTRYRNTGAAPVYVTSADMLPLSFSDLNTRYTSLVVSQWSTQSFPEDFGQTQMLLNTDDVPVTIRSGAGERHCGWLAVRGSDDRGLFAGWEFDGSAKTTIRHDADEARLVFASEVQDLNHPVQPSDTFDIPSAFVGLFHGDFDEAGYRTQRFVEAVLAKKPPAGTPFPYVSWDSWAYQDTIDEQTLLQNADLAASTGVELFVVDLGWARSIGDWFADDAKFPHGLAAVSQHVHDLGMRFGLHFALTEADANSPVLQANPDWTSSDASVYHGALSLCLSNAPARDWVIQQAIRMIDDYSVDWILQDGANVVKHCTKTTHTHDAADSNYSNAVDGLDYVVAAVQAARPNVLWENCENGGSMMTFQMVKNYVTSITNDASGSLQARAAVYGATYPFPPRYSERYMPHEDGVSEYSTHSYRFGGPWVLMNRLADLAPDDMTFLKGEVQFFKQGRTSISQGKVFHLGAPSLYAIDAIQSYDATTDSATAVVTRTQSQSAFYKFVPKGLNPQQRYTVTFEVSPSVYSMTGQQLMSSGVPVLLPTPYTSDIVHIDRQ